MNEKLFNPIIEFITNYWAQITVILTVFFRGIQHIVKLFLDWSIKKREIIYSTIFTKRTTALESFVFNTLEYQRFFKDLPYYEVGSQKIKPKELDDMKDKFKVPFSKSYCDLNIYIETEYKITIKEIDVVFLYNSKHLEKLFYSNLSENQGYTTNDYFAAIQENGKKLDNLIEKLISSTGFGKVVIK